MIITLSPQRRDDTLDAYKQGDKLTINGTEYDFSQVPDGATLPSDAIDCDYIVGDVDRIDGVLHITLLLPLKVDASEIARFPEPIENPVDGALELPQ